MWAHEIFADLHKLKSCHDEEMADVASLLLPLIHNSHVFHMGELDPEVGGFGGSSMPVKLPWYDPPWVNLRMPYTDTLIEYSCLSDTRAMVGDDEKTEYMDTGSRVADFALLIHEVDAGLRIIFDLQKSTVQVQDIMPGWSPSRRFIGCYSRLLVRGDTIKGTREILFTPDLVQDTLNAVTKHLGSKKPCKFVGEYGSFSTEGYGNIMCFTPEKYSQMIGKLPQGTEIKQNLLVSAYTDAVVANMVPIMLNTVHGIECVKAFVKDKVRRKSKFANSENLFNYTILRPLLAADSGESYGTDGIPKRKHWVRGHYAHYTPEAPLFGKYAGIVWKPQHLQGQASGFVAKEYDMREEA